jgi:hypothetical protein
MELWKQHSCVVKRFLTAANSQVIPKGDWFSERESEISPKALNNLGQGSTLGKSKSVFLYPERVKQVS